MGVIPNNYERSIMTNTNTNTTGSQRLVTVGQAPTAKQAFVLTVAVPFKVLVQAASYAAGTVVATATVLDGVEENDTFFGSTVGKVVHRAKTQDTLVNAKKGYETGNSHVQAGFNKVQEFAQSFGEVPEDEVVEQTEEKAPQRPTKSGK